MDSPKRILLITRYFPPLDGVATSRMYSWAKYLQRSGYIVDVLTTNKDKQVVEPLNWDCSFFRVIELSYFDPISSLGFDKKAVISSAVQGDQGVRGRVRKACAGFYRYRMNERIPSRTDAWVIAARRWLKNEKQQGGDYDIIISSYGPPSAHIIGCMAKRNFSAYWLADYRDLWIENASFKGLWPFTVLERQIERHCIAQADALSSVSPPFSRKLQEKFPQIPAYCIENGYDPELWKDLKGDYFEGQEKKFRMVHMGSVYPHKRDPRPALEGIARAKQAGWITARNFEMSFYGTVMGELAQLVEQYSLGELVRIAGSTAQDDSYRIQRSADALLFLGDPNPPMPGILTGKLFEYLVSGTPIIATATAAHCSVGQVIVKAEAGYVCNDNPARVAEALKCLVEGASRFRTRQEVTEYYSREKQVQRLIATFPEELQC